MSTSRHAHLVLGVTVPRDATVFGPLEDRLTPDEWIGLNRATAVRTFGDPENSDDVLIGVALVSVQDFSRGRDFAPVPALTPDPRALIELERVVKALGVATQPALFVCGESL